MRTQFKAMLADCEGASLVEYALVVTLIAIVCIVAVALLGTKTSGLISTSAASV